MAPITSIASQVILLGDVNGKELAGAILTALESEPLLVPTHWGPAGIRDPYDRDAILAALQSNDYGLVPYVLRTKAPGRYSAWWYGTEARTAGALHLESRGKLSPAEAEGYFSALARIAGRLPIDWAHVDLKFEGQSDATAMLPGSSAFHLGLYSDIGPECLFPRSFFGPRLLELVGGEQALAGAELPAEKLASGALQLDLVALPWASNAETLKRAQERAHAALFPLGIFAQPKGKWEHSPGPRWRPPA